MFEIDLKSRKTIYEQVVDNIRELIMVGVINPDQKIPSVRELSKTLTVNPNTILKAYNELERLGYIYTVSGRGTFAAKRDVDNPPDKLLVEKSQKNIAAEIRELYYLGCNKEYISTLLNDLNNQELEIINKRRSE